MERSGIVLVNFNVTFTPSNIGWTQFCSGVPRPYGNEEILFVACNTKAYKQAYIGKVLQGALYVDIDTTNEVTIRGAVAYPVNS